MLIEKPYHLITTPCVFSTTNHLYSQISMKKARPRESKSTQRRVKTALKTHDTNGISMICNRRSLLRAHCPIRHNCAFERSCALQLFQSNSSSTQVRTMEVGFAQ